MQYRCQRRAVRTFKKNTYLRIITSNTTRPRLLSRARSPAVGLKPPDARGNPIGPKRIWLPMKVNRVWDDATSALWMKIAQAHRLWMSALVDQGTSNWSCPWAVNQLFNSPQLHLCNLNSKKHLAVTQSTSGTQTLNGIGIWSYTDFKKPKFIWNLLLHA